MALKAWRESQEPRITQHHAAVALGAASVFTVSKWERGLQPPTVVEALAIERFTGGAVPVAWWAEVAELPPLAERETLKEPAA